MRGLGDCRFQDASRLGVRRAGPVVHRLCRHLGTRPVLADAGRGHLYRPHARGLSLGQLHAEPPVPSDAAGTGFAAPLPLTPGFCALSILFTDWDRQGTPDCASRTTASITRAGRRDVAAGTGQPPVAFTEADGWQRLRIWGMGIAQEDLTFDGFPSSS